MTTNKSLELTERDLVMLLYKDMGNPYTTPLSDNPDKELKTEKINETL